MATVVQAFQLPFKREFGYTEAAYFVTCVIMMFQNTPGIVIITKFRFP